jgi:hypothetical protein
MTLRCSGVTSSGIRLLLVVIVWGAPPIAFSQPAEGKGPEWVRATIDQYCVRCHNNRLRTGGLVLEGRPLEDMTPSDVEAWEKAVKKLLGGAMPPPAASRPDEVTYARLITGLQNALDRRAATSPRAGRPAIHRLNRAEYTNAIRDLLKLEVDGTALLPADTSSYGFDNVADVLTMSPGLLERYLFAAKTISRLAVGDPTIRPATTSYNVPYMTLAQDEHMSDELPWGSKGGVAVRHHFPVDGEYEVAIRLQRNSLNVGNVIRGLDVRNEIDVRLDGVRLTVFKMTAGQGGAGYRATQDRADDALTLRFPAKAGMHTLGVSFNGDHWYVEGVGMSRLPLAGDGYASGTKTEQNFGRVDIGVDHIDITGPFDAVLPVDSASRRNIFICRPAGIPKPDEACAATILSTLARRAYRRPLAPKEIATLLEFFKAGRDEDGGFDDGIERGLVRILTDPNFLVRIELDPVGVKPGTPYQVSDLELASRLSFFLWSTIPDEALLDEAVAGRLREPLVLERQVRRMLADARSEALIENFFGQWLLLRDMATIRPDPKAFPEFDDNLREAFQTETRLFLKSQLQDNRPLTEILTADYTFVNERLARHYGLPNIQGSHFRRVKLPDGRRGGILGHGSLLTATSYADRTSVVVRGKFVLENILGTPPPPPPPDVPPLENTTVQGSLRQRMELHRANPVCAACHSQLDPLGFALENFDGIGQWRAKDGGVGIDASGAFPDGTSFSGPQTFREALLRHRDAYVGTLTEKLLTYALGRGVEPFDMPAVRAIIRDTETDGNTWSALILHIIKCLPFQMRETES